MANALILKPLPLTGATASSTMPGHDPAYVGNDFMGVVWRSAAAASTDLVVDLGRDQTIDTALLLGCSGATAAMTLEVATATSAAGSVFAAAAAQPFLAGSEMPTSGRGIAFWQAAAPIVARYVRFRIGGLGGAQAVVARVAVGAAIRLGRNFSTGSQFGVRDLGKADFSRHGVLLRNRGAKLRTIGLSFQSIDKPEVEAAVHPLLEQVGNTEVIAMVTDPAADPMRQRRIYFGPLVGDLGTALRKANFYQAQANLVSLV